MEQNDHQELPFVPKFSTFLEVCDIPALPLPQNLPWDDS